MGQMQNDECKMMNDEVRITNQESGVMQHGTEMSKE